MNGLAITAPAPLPLAMPKAKPRERLYSIEEYLALEETSLDNHEFHNGKLIPMAGGMPNHSLIKARTVTALNNKLDESKQRSLVFNSDIRIHLPMFGRAVMPDAVVVTGTPRFSIEKPVGLLLNPTLIIEVLSEGTESYDRGDKFARYRTLPSFEEYVLVSQHQPRVETFVKKDGKWFIHEDASGMDASVELVTLGLHIALADLYRNVVFEEAESGSGKRRRKAS